MSWSIPIGSVSGIRLQIHFTFVLFLVWLVGSGLAQGKPQDVVLSNGLFVLGLFSCVILHELGHALTAKHYGIRTKDITLLPIGGVARLERMPTDPWQELWVALAGPAVNVVIAAGLIVWLVATRGAVELGGETALTGDISQRLLIANLTLVVFNMLPAFPMDGGRVLRALLATQMEYTRATQMAANLGQAMALLFGVVGFLYNPVLLFIAFFVWIGAGQEASMVLLHSAISGIPVRAAMITSFEVVTPEDSLETVVQLVLRGSQQDFPVVDGEKVVGVVTRDGLVRALAEKSDATAGEIMEREIATADASDMLEGAFQRLQESPCHTVPVLDSGRLAGILTAENVGEFLMIQSARHGGRGIRVPR